MKRFNHIFFIGCIAGLLVACTGQNTPTDPTSGTTPTDTTLATTDTIRITWNGASVTIEGSNAGVTVTDNNGYVSVTSTVKDITYLLSGSGTGQLSIYSTNRLQLLLAGLSLTCPDGPAINNQCKKSCFVVLEGTNSLTDGSTYAASDEDRKAAFFSEGQLIFSGSGSLSVKGNYKHAIASDDYIQFASSTGSVALTAVSDGIHANDGLYFDGGAITINAGEEGIQCDTAEVIVNGGTITVTNAGDKGILAYGDITVNGGTIRISSDYKCIKTQSNLTVTGGDIQAICNGQSSGGGGGRPGGGGGSSSETSPEGIEAKGTITITGGTVYAQAADDAINAGSHMTITGGYVCAYSTGNDGLDANGNCYIKGGVVYAIGAGNAENAIDANTEDGYKLYVQGGTIVTIGNLESGSSLTQSCYSASSWNQNTWYALTVGSDIFAFKTPSSGGSPLVVSGATTPTLKSGVTAGGTAIFNSMAYYPATASGGTNVSLSAYSGGNSGGGPGGGGGRPW